MAKLTFQNVEIHPDARLVKGLPSEGKARTNEIAAIRNALARAGGELVQRTPDVYACKTSEAAEAVRQSVKVSGRGPSGRYSAEDMFA